MTKSYENKVFIAKYFNAKMQKCTMIMKAECHSTAQAKAKRLYEDKLITVRLREVK